jgi:hypothetical protein
VQLRALGDAVRARYLAAGVDTAVAGGSPSYTNAVDAFAVSSEVSRTLASSRAFLAGLYPDKDGSLRVPTHVFDVEDRDWILRGYSLCPAVNHAIEKFLGGAEYEEKAKAVEAAGVLRRVAAAIKEKVDLGDAYNTYDRYVLARGADYDGVEPGLPVISDAEFAAVKDAADWIESRKYAHRDVAGALASAALMAKMVNYSEAAAGGSASAGKHRIVEYSGHYPLLHGALAALGVDSGRFTDGRSAAAKNASTTVPEFGAALIWELHSDAQVRLLWRAAGAVGEFVDIPCDGASSYSCPLADVKARLEKVSGGAIASDEAFCKTCGIDGDVNGLLCSGGVGGGGSASHSSSSSGLQRAAAGAGGFAGGVLAGLALACVYFLCVVPRKGRRAAHGAPIEPTTGMGPKVSSDGSGRTADGNLSHLSDADERKV